MSKRQRIEKVSQVPKKTTMSDIARYCGISRQVVSAILLPDEKSTVRFSQQTYDAVVAAAEKFNFRPNRTARSLLKHNHGSFGLLVQSLGNIPPTVLHRMLSWAKKYDKVLIMDHFGDEFDELPIIIKEDTVDGIVVFEDIPERFQQEIERHNIPCIQVNNSSTDSPGSITYDEEQGMELAIKHLRAKGRNKIVLLSSTGNHYSVSHRRNGFVKLMKKLKAEYLVADLCGDKHLDDYIFKFLKENADIDGIILSNDGLVVDTYAALQKLGLKVPDDVSVVGVNDFNVCTNVSPALTAVGIDKYTIGETVIETLFKYVSDPTAKPENIKLKYQLYERDSC